MITLMPVSCWKKGMRMAMYIPPWMLDSFGFLTGGHEIIILILNIFSAADLQKHFFSFFCVPSLNEEFGVSGRRREPRVMMAAGTAASPKLTRQPQLPAIFAVP
ncbi:hypothetical protein ACMD2_00597 [Ananas comosus]|uniref:Uncharacterized protein n=1 Tax=Ananas comosus TaxID=4615 RepID=A0A199VE08_ANACO|nr:hypothetical protein ACMD2_00597 [Ananas comosus]